MMNRILVYILMIGSALARVPCWGALPEIIKLETAPVSRISWSSTSGEVYQVQTTATLHHADWNNVEPPAVAQSNVTSLAEFSVENDAGFYRVMDRKKRADGAYKLNLPITGSLQNPAWSPDGQFILFTRFRAGYNQGAADLMILSLRSNALRTLVEDGSTNVNLPGSVWNGLTHSIVFSSARDPHDEIFMINESGTPGEEQPITSREERVAYEPSLSSDGTWVVFESHVYDVETNGIITKYAINQEGPYLPLTGENEDCRQPNWSPTDATILYQKLDAQQWDLWVMSTNGTSHLQLTHGPGDKTDASFSPDGKTIIYSSDHGDLVGANLFSVPRIGGSPTRVSFSDGYDGAPSWSPDGKNIIFESDSHPDPDDSAGTTLWIKPF